MMKSRIRVAAAVFCFFGLSACSNGKFTFGNALGDISRVTGVKTGLEEATESSVVPASLTATAEGPPLIVGFKDIRVALPLVGRSGSKWELFRGTQPLAKWIESSCDRRQHDRSCDRILGARAGKARQISLYLK